MKFPTLIAAVIASAFALGAAAPAFADIHHVRHHHRHAHHLMKRVDTNHDGRISHAEMLAALGRSFAVLDTNHDGVLSRAELADSRNAYRAHRQELRAERKHGRHVAGVIRIPHRVVKHFDRLDRNHDGVLSQAELDRVARHMFRHRDRNGDGYISRPELKA